MIICEKNIPEPLLQSAKQPITAGRRVFALSINLLYAAKCANGWETMYFYGKTGLSAVIIGYAN